MQGSKTPVSASSKGGKAGPSTSSSCNRSSSSMDNLVDGESNATRKKTSGTSLSHDCPKSADTFCYICSRYEVKSLRKEIDEGVEKLYENCFGCKVQHQDTDWVPHIICNSCRMMLYRCKKSNNQKYRRYSAPTIWKRPRYLKDCYFCMNDVKGITAKHKGAISYINVPTVIRATELDTQECKAVQIHGKNDTEVAENSEEVSHEMSHQSEEECNDSNDTDDDNDNYVASKIKSKAPILVSQLELSDFIRDLGLPKDGAEFTASFFKNRNFLKPNTKVSFYRNRDEEFRKFFTKDEETTLVYCTDVRGLMNQMKKNAYKDEEWRLFIDSSKRSIKGVLLHNTNNYAPIPIAHSTNIKEEYNNVRMLLEKVKYASHKWQICGDLKIITMILGQQSGFTREPCYLCLWNSRDRANHYSKKHWPNREIFEPGSHNVINESLVDPDKILLPPLHIKLGLMKQFVKALNKDGKCFRYLGRKFPSISDAKLKEGVFDGPQIRTLFRDADFVTQMTDVEKKAWESFKAVAQNFLGNKKSPDYKEIVATMVQDYQNLGCLMNLKLHFLDSHLDKFPENVGDFSEEQGERFHQDMKVVEQRYQGRWDEVMMSDFCWMLKREGNERGRKRKRNPLHRSFEEKRTRYSSKKSE